MNGNSAKTVESCFVQSFSPDLNIRKQAETALKSFEKPGFTIMLLEITGNQSNATSQAAVIYLKNYIQKNWHLNENDSVVKSEERKQIKQIILKMMLKSTNIVSNFLKAIIQIICKTDFPDNWQNLMPELIQNLSTNDIAIVKGSLEVMDSIFERYQNTERSLKLDKELLYLSKILVNPLTDFFNKTMSLLSSGNSDQFFSVMSPMLGAFKKLITLELLESIESKSHIWLGGIHKLLKHQNEQDVSLWPDLSIQVKKEILQIVDLFCEKYDDCVSYSKAEKEFLNLTFQILSKIPTEKRYDDLVIEGIKYVTQVLAKPNTKNIINLSQIFKVLLENVVFPNIFLRNEDIEEFKYNPMEYYRKDLENSINLTRRKAAFDLIQVLNNLSESEITKTITNYVSQLNKEYVENPSQNWLKKDAALFLIISISVKSRTERYGVMRVTDNFDVKTFLANNVFPELTGSSSNNILRADCLKILIYFRSHIENSNFDNVSKLL
ncbi:hypothetical protein MHBO_000703, partial [Bonamia ostreae]